MFFLHPFIKKLIKKLTQRCESCTICHHAPGRKRMKSMKRIIGITFVFLVLGLPVMAQSACAQLGAMTGAHVDCSHPQIQQRPSETPAYSPAVLPPDSPFYHQPPSTYRGN